MKLLRTIIALALVNSLILIAVVSFGTKKQLPKEISPSLDTKIVVTATPALANTLSPTAAPSRVITTSPTTVPVTAPTTAPTAAPTAIVTAAPTVAPTAAVKTNPNACLIQVDSVSYDVTSFRNQHSGGDIFQCGTDMSSIFWSQHNSRILNMMAPYKI
jgi:hypothetical protein